MDLREINKQFRSHAMGGACESLHYAVFERAVLDLGKKDEDDIRTARIYLTQKIIPHAAVCGLETTWIQKLLRRIGAIK